MVLLSLTVSLTYLLFYFAILDKLIFVVVLFLTISRPFVTIYVINPRTAGPGILRVPPLQNLPLPCAPR